MKHFVLSALLIIAVGIAAACPALAESTGNIAKGFLAKTLKFEGKDVKYVVYVPSTYDPKTPMPTILFLHGYGECGIDGWHQVAVGLPTAVMSKVGFLAIPNHHPPEARLRCPVGRL